MSNGMLHNPLGGTEESGPISDFGLAQDPVRTTVDLWDMGQGDYLSDDATLPSADQFSNATQYINADSDNSEKMKRIMIIVGLCILATVAVTMLLPSDHDDPLMMEYDARGNPMPKAEGGMFDGLMDSAKSLMGLDQQVPPMEMPGPNDLRKIDPGAVTKGPEIIKTETQLTEISNAVPQDRVVQVVEGNPYWILPNQLRGQEPKLGRAWGADEEDGWRRMLQSPYTYQQYKMVQDIRQRKLAGSEVLLFEALNSRKFWTRMAAVIGIAEFGYPVDMVTVDKAIGNARSDLVANYFKRFRLKPTGAEAFIMRHAVKLVGERARQHILQGLLRSSDDLSKLYLVAAIYDPSETIQKWIHTGINQVKIKTDTFLLYDKIVKGMIKPPLDMRKDDFIATNRTNYERVRELAMGILLYGNDTEEVKGKENPDDGFSDLEVIEVKSEEF